MTDKNADIAESIIRLEGLTFALACIANKGGENHALAESRALLKARIIRELDLAEARGSHP